MPRLYVDLIESVGLVDAGDNPEAVVTLFKRADNPTDGRAAAIMAGDGTAGRSGLHEGDRMATVNLDAIDDEQLRDQIGKQLETQADRIEALEAELAEAREAAEADPDETDPLEKADPAVKAEVEALRKRAEEQQAALAAEVRKRRISETGSAPWVKTVFGDDNPDGVEALVTLADADPDAYQVVEQQMKALAGRAELADVFKEYGSAGEGDGDDPIVKRDRFVKAYLADHPDETPAQARAKFWESNPDIHKQLRETN